jgi:hypothetical protein
LINGANQLIIDSGKSAGGIDGDGTEKGNEISAKRGNQLWFCVKPDFLDRGGGAIQERMDEVEHFLDVIREPFHFFLLGGDATSEIPMERDDMAELNEGAHDGNIDLNGASASKNRGQHGYAGLSENEGGAPQSHFVGEIGGHKL